MKKFLPYILILTIVVQLFAPFSVNRGVKNNLEVTTNKAEAKTGDWYFLIYTRDQTNGTKSVHDGEPSCNTARTSFIESDAFKNNYKPDGSGAYYTSMPSDCVPEGEEQIWVDAYMFKVTDNSGQTIFTSENFQTDQNSSAKDKCETSRNLKIDEIGVNNDNLIVGECTAVNIQENLNDFLAKPKDESGFPACSLWSPSTYGGCIGIVLYWLLFKTTSFIFGLTGKILDFTLMYSISDGAYRSGFVVQGWGIVRDFCNMFFIFVLLYIAFGTILGLHSVKTKEMIINVVIIGLLINFSLFATQVIIDASNILARVFYNQNTIITGVKDPTTGVINNQLGEFGEIKLSEAIVSKVDPQKLVIEAKKVSGIKQDGISNEDTPDGISAGSFIIVVLLATIVNIVGMIAFLSAGLIFIARVIGLWLAMIVSPLVFFSYTVPALQDMEMVGWKRWWPETLKLAFLAPVFAFFMYLVVGFMDKGMGVIDASRQDGVGLGFLVAIIVPFVFIMILLMKAKDIAKDMSGKMGQSITNGIAAAGGIALGGAALGGAALLRRGIGGTLAKASRGDTSTQKYEEAKRMKAMGDSSAMDKLNWRQKAKGATGKFFQMDKIYGTDKGNFDIITQKPVGVSGGLGGLLNKKQKDVGDIDHARSVMDETAKAAHVTGADGEALGIKEMSGVQLDRVEKKFNETKRSETESAVRKGFDNKGDILLEDTTTGTMYKGEDAFKAANRKAITQDVSSRTGAFLDGDVDRYGKLTDAGNKKIVDELNIKLNAAVKIATDNKLSENFTHIKDEASTKVNPLTRGFARANTNSYDLRKLSDLKSDKRESAIFSKIPVALIAGIATGVRAGMKNVGVSNGGIKVSGDFMKDLGNTISDSLKGMKVNVDLSHVGEHKSSADSHGGGGHH